MKRKNKILITVCCIIILIAEIIFLFLDNEIAFLFKSSQGDLLSILEPTNYNTTESYYKSKEKDNPTNKTTTEKDNINGQTMTILFLGIDRTKERDESIGIFRSDTIMITRINIKDKTIKILSIPRDTYTYIPLIDRKDKINHAYAYGSLEGKGVISAINAIEQFLQKTKIENYFLLEMEPISDIIDAIGGVELDVEIDMKTHGADLSKGLQLLDGQKAFDYIHWRYSSDGDIGRIERQHKFIKTLLGAIKYSDKSDQLMNILLNYMDYYETNLPIEQIGELFNSYLHIMDDNIQFYSIPGKGEIIDNIWYWVPNLEDMEKVLLDFYS